MSGGRAGWVCGQGPGAWRPSCEAASGRLEEKPRKDLSGVGKGSSMSSSWGVRAGDLLEMPPGARRIRSGHSVPSGTHWAQGRQVASRVWGRDGSSGVSEESGLHCCHGFRFRPSPCKVWGPDRRPDPTEPLCSGLWDGPRATVGGVGGLGVGAQSKAPAVCWARPGVCVIVPRGEGASASPGWALALTRSGGRKRELPSNQASLLQKCFASASPRGALPGAL